MSTSAVRG
ncbi:hypothetical protein YPPY102_2805, partial [Yersinia pestis PY-102]